MALAVIFVFISLFWSLVNSHTSPYLSFMGQTVSNHSYVNLTLVGRPDWSQGGHSVQCHTNLPTCCSGAEGPYRGNWYFPNGTRLPLPNGDTAVFASRLAQRVDLRRNFGDVPTGISGIYRCDIPIMEDNPVKKSVFVGLYSHERGS